MGKIGKIGKMGKIGKIGKIGEYYRANQIASSFATANILAMTLLPTNCGLGKIPI
jgi:hypothetical protein